MKNFWLSWTPAVLGHDFVFDTPWPCRQCGTKMRISGDTEEQAPVYCAAVRAVDAAHAKAIISDAYEETVPQFCFCDPKEDGWSPFNHKEFKTPGT